MSVFIGVDGGGTKTQVLVISGNQGATVIAPSSNPNTVGWATAQQVVVQAIDDCLHAMNLRLDDVKGISLCMSGVDRADESTRLQTIFQTRFPKTLIEVKNDALAALTAGTKGESGIVLIAGTGSIAVGESDTGEIARAGGYGYLLGDEGSGFTIGRNGLIAAIQSFEGRAPKTILWERAAKVYDVTHPNTLIPIVYRAERPINTIAMFAKEVISMADEDPVANQLVNTVISEYRQLIATVFQNLNGNMGRTVVLSGGLFTNTDVLVHRLQAAEPTIHFIPLMYSAASGAVLRAIKGCYQYRGQSHTDAVELWQSNINNLVTHTESNSNVGHVITYP